MRDLEQQIAKIEGGIVDPRLSTLRRIAEALECEVSEIFYTRREFLAEISATVDDKKIDLKRIKLTQLNALCASERDLPAYHPFWEEVQIVKGKIAMRKKK